MRELHITRRIRLDCQPHGVEPDGVTQQDGMPWAIRPGQCIRRRSLDCQRRGHPGRQVRLLDVEELPHDAIDRGNPRLRCREAKILLPQHRFAEMRIRRERHQRATEQHRRGRDRHDRSEHLVVGRVTERRWAAIVDRAGANKSPDIEDTEGGSRFRCKLPGLGQVRLTLLRRSYQVIVQPGRRHVVVAGNTLHGRVVAHRTAGRPDYGVELSGWIDRDLHHPLIRRGLFQVASRVEQEVLVGACDRLHRRCWPGRRR